MQVVFRQNSICTLNLNRTQIQEVSAFHQFFRPYGQLLAISVLPDRVYLQFRDLLSAFYAKIHLHRRASREFSLQLHFVHKNPLDLDTSLNWQCYEFTPSASRVEENPSEVEQPQKFTCKFLVQIENERKFQVARRIIGRNGCHMKAIIDLCQDSSRFDCEVVKLRLRGKGSGFKEGFHQRESQEPLNLCVSSRFRDKFQLACEQVE
jgi:hypothetical protein